MFVNKYCSGDNAFNSGGNKIECMGGSPGRRIPISKHVPTNPRQRVVPFVDNFVGSVSLVPTDALRDANVFKMIVDYPVDTVFLFMIVF